MLILFDLDGTLTDPAEGITRSIDHALRGMGREVDGDLRRYIGPPLRTAFGDMLDTADADEIERAVCLFRERFGTVGLFENALYPGVVEMLEALVAEGFELRVATAKARVYADRIIDHFGLRRFFPTVYGPELDGTLGDKRELIDHLLERERANGALRSGACMIGDRSHDVVAARANGMPAIGVLWGYGSERELRDAGAERVVRTVAELPHAIAALAS